MGIGARSLDKQMIVSDPKPADFTAIDRSAETTGRFFRTSRSIGNGRGRATIPPYSTPSMDEEDPQESHRFHAQRGELHFIRLHPIVRRERQSAQGIEADGHRVRLAPRKYPPAFLRVWINPCEPAGSRQRAIPNCRACRHVQGRIRSESRRDRVVSATRCCF